MGSVAAGLGAIGNTLGVARQLSEQDAERKRKLAIEQQYAQIQQQYANQEKSKIDFEKQREQSMAQERDLRVQILGEQLKQSRATPADKIAAAEKALGPLTPEQKLYIGYGLKPTPVKAPTLSPYDRKQQEMQATEDMYKKYPDLRPKKGTGSKAGGSVLPDKTLKALADKWQNEGIKPPAKYQADVETYMEENNMQAKVKLSAQEQKLSDLTKQIQPKLDQLQKLIEDNKLTEQGGVMAAARQQYEFEKYRHGLEPDKVHGDLIKAAAALQVMGAAPWVQIGRGRYLFDTVKQHLPSPTDSPALLYDKVQFLRGIIEEAQASLPQQQKPDDTSGWTPVQ